MKILSLFEFPTKKLKERKPIFAELFAKLLEKLLMLSSGSIHFYCQFFFFRTYAVESKTEPVNV